MNESSKYKLRDDGKGRAHSLLKYISWLIWFRGVDSYGVTRELSRGDELRKRFLVGSMGVKFINENLSK